MKKILLYLVLIFAVGMAGIVAYVSVNGLLKVFSGAGTLGLLLFSFIEFSKIIATSAIHTFGKKIGWFYNSLLSLGIVIAMAITSMGIYGFLSSTYKETFTKLENVNAQVELLETKKNGYQEQLDVITNEKNSINNRISDLSKGLSNNVIEYKDPETGQIIRTTSSSTRKTLEKQLDIAIERQDVLNAKSDTLSNKIFRIENEILETKLNNESSSELGPLKYLADVTGMTMDDVMKWFILLLIVIGDPMAVLMVIVFNKVANYGNNDKVVKKKRKLLDIFKKKKEEPKPILTDSYEGSITTNSGEVNLGVINDEPKKVLVPEIKEEVQVERKEEKKPITREDIKEIKEEERGFSVTIPTRKKDNTRNSIDRIGSNKEVRDGKTDTVYFKRRK
jgi:hypothetical protein